MIHHSYDNNDVETVVESGVCAHHREHPGSNFAGCTCWSHYTTRRRDKDSTETVQKTRNRSPVGTVYDMADECEALANIVKLAPFNAAARVIREQADEIDRLRDKVQDLRMHAQQDACEMERLFTKNNDLISAGDDIADLLVGIASSRLDAREKATVDKYLVKWKEARRGQ